MDDEISFNKKPYISPAVQTINNLHLKIECELYRQESYTQELTAKEELRKEVVEKAMTIKAHISEDKNALQVLLQQLEDSKAARPWLYLRLCKTAKYKDWIKQHALIEASYNRTQRTLSLNQNRLILLDTQYAATMTAIKTINLNISHSKAIIKTKNLEVVRVMKTQVKMASDESES